MHVHESNTLVNTMSNVQMKRIHSTHTTPVLLIDDIWRYIIRMYYMIRYKEQLQGLIDTTRSNGYGFVTPDEGIEVPLYHGCIRYAATSIFYDICASHPLTHSPCYGRRIDVQYIRYQYRYYPLPSNETLLPE